jgi:hypothetical protein
MCAPLFPFTQDKKARKATRNELRTRRDQPEWLREFASRLPEGEAEVAQVDQVNK